MAGEIKLDISKITDYLYISAWPKAENAAEIEALNSRLILSMHWWKPNKRLNEPPLRLLWLPTLDTPITPIPLASLWRGVDAALPVIAEGSAVLAHCRVGMHRSVAMASSVLIAKGYSAADAMSLIKARREKADPYAPYIQARIVKFEEEWRQRGDGSADQAAM
jgi:hypothetical protein